jgi:pimeloyl-ACP methyl ester carboxylesterase
VIGRERLIELSFRSAGERCAGWLHLPDRDGPHPGVVLLHSTAGLRQMHCYAGRGRAFAAAGIATLQLAQLDAERLALWGGSASCAQVIDAATREKTISAVICLAPFVPGRATQRSAGTPLARLGAAALADRIRTVFGREPRGVLVGGEPGETAILVRENAASRERAMLPGEARLDPSGQRAELSDGVIWENRIVLRPRLRAPHPLRRAAKVLAPLLVVAGDEDQLCPPGPAAELSRRAPRGELKTFPTGHFDLYDGASIAAETEFLVRCLKADGGAGLA